MKLILVYLLLVSLPVFASPDTERQIYELEVTALHLQQEQQTIFQQFQMLQELRRHEIMEGGDAFISQRSPATDGEFPKYEDMAKRQKERLDRMKRYTTDLNELYARYQEIESERRLLIDQLNGLKLGKGIPVEEE